LCRWMSKKAGWIWKTQGLPRHSKFPVMYFYSGPLIIYPAE
jgi:hypothetical protein